MPNVPKFCEHCNSVYWTDPDNNEHGCRQELLAPLTFYIPPTKEKPKKSKTPKKQHSIKCKGCSCHFDTEMHWKIFCSLECRDKYYRGDTYKAHLKALADKRPKLPGQSPLEPKPVYEYICKNCENSFKTEHSNRRVYCSPECKFQYERVKAPNKEWMSRKGPPERKQDSSKIGKKLDWDATCPEAGWMKKFKAVRG